ncbi:MAG TPA: GAF domain-containing protein [Holophagaceae bacterium]
MGLFGAKGIDEALQRQGERLRLAEADAADLRIRLGETRELVALLDGDRNLLLAALERLRPGLGPQALSEALLEICFKPLGLACFYVALADWEADQLRFVLYHEGGRARPHPSRNLSGHAGLSERVLESGQPLYIRTLEEGLASGSLLTAAEQATGLIPHSWYGVPMGWGERPMGLVSFQSFQTDAFDEDRRRIMAALVRILALGLVQSR